MVRPRFGFVLLVSFSTFVAAQFEEAAGDFGSGEYPPSSPPPPSRPPRPPYAPILCGAAGQPPCGRLVASGPNLLLDGAPFVARGVAYNPTPAGADRADYLADGNAAIWARALPVLEALGANLLRVPPFATNGDHSAFLVEAGRRALTVMGEFPLVASDFDADGEFSAVNEDSGNGMRRAASGNRGMGAKKPSMGRRNSFEGPKGAGGAQMRRRQSRRQAASW